MTTPPQAPPPYPCPHGRGSWMVCPHCNGISAALPPLTPWTCPDRCVRPCTCLQPTEAELRAALEHGARGAAELAASLAGQFPMRNASGGQPAKEPAGISHPQSEKEPAGMAARIVGIDHGAPGGDHTAEMSGEVQPDGTLRIDSIKVTQPTCPDCGRSTDWRDSPSCDAGSPEPFDSDVIDCLRIALANTRAELARVRDLCVAAFGEGTTPDMLVGISHDHEQLTHDSDTALAREKARADAAELERDRATDRATEYAGLTDAAEAALAAEQAAHAITREARSLAARLHSEEGARATILAGQLADEKAAHAETRKRLPPQPPDRDPRQGK